MNTKTNMEEYFLVAANFKIQKAHFIFIGPRSNNYCVQ